MHLIGNVCFVFMGKMLLCVYDTLSNNIADFEYIESSYRSEQSNDLLCFYLTFSGLTFISLVCTNATSENKLHLPYNN